MLSKSWAFWALVAFAAIAGIMAFVTSRAPKPVPSPGRGVDASGKPTEAPRVSYDGKGEVTARFSAEESPRLAKWWNGTTHVSCPAGYHFKVNVNVAYEADTTQESATCEPNPRTP